MSEDEKNKDNNKQEFVFEELNKLKSDLDSAKNMPEELKEEAMRMVTRLSRMAKLGHYATEFDTLSRYIETIVSVPWGEMTEEKYDLESVKEILDREHYGMEGVKERILEYIATMILLKQRGQDALSKSPVMLLVGLHGVGKTTLAESIAEALGREFVRIPLGAIGSSLEIRGRSKSLPQSEPGQILKALIRAKSMNPVILLDEVEKASGQAGLQSDIMAILLEVLDPNQNDAFRDYYIDFPVDLSNVMFICSANNTGPISAALLDRMEVIKMNSYTDEEKMIIARDFLFPKVIEETGIKKEELEVDPALWPHIIRPLGYDSGIRSLRRTLQAICRKIAKEIVEGKVEKVYLSQENLKEYIPSAI